jgi:CheY-like chemotaxis protein
LKGTSLLIVEDEALASLLLRDCLESHGFAVTAETASGAEALASATSDPPAVALVDIVIKGDIDGIETARRLRSLGKTEVIFTTGQGDSVTRARADALGHSGYLLKPFTCEQVIGAIHQALDPKVR